MSTRVEPTDEQFDAAKKVACEIADHLKSVGPDVAIGAMSLLVNAMFSRTVKAEYRLAAYDDFSKTVRNGIKDGLL